MSTQHAGAFDQTQKATAQEYLLVSTLNNTLIRCGIRRLPQSDRQRPAHYSPAGSPPATSAASSPKNGCGSASDCAPLVISGGATVVRCTCRCSLPIGVSRRPGVLLASVATTL